MLNLILLKVLSKINIVCCCAPLRVCLLILCAFYNEPIWYGDSIKTNSNLLDCLYHTLLSVFTDKVARFTGNSYLVINNFVA